ncbi:hypothetical protein GCM10023342_21360 [Modicisalibacter zincidurans]|uniref:Uncharacterized protein n=1 Tax=Modicisalibacter zincidurans TaxID=1178777 RepID=A0ABP9REJ1_9GAMM
MRTPWIARALALVVAAYAVSPIVGIVTRFNRKSVIVLTEDGTKQYKVSPELLKPLREMVNHVVE